MVNQRPPILLGFFFCFIFLFGSPQKVSGAELNGVQVLPERMKSNVSPGKILITFETNQTVTENGVRVTVGTAWSINTQASNFTTSSSNLPSGITAAPAINTASSISGQQISFPLGDLSPNTRYGFYITGGIPTNPLAGSSSDYLWTVSTLVGGVPQDSLSLMVPVLQNDQIAINASVGPLVSQFETQLSAVPTTQIIGPNSTVEYTITYSSSYDPNTPLTLQAEWSLGTIEGSGVATQQIFEYVPGSATNAYGNTAPVIDPINRTITWSIPNIPFNTLNQTVSFQLKTANLNLGTQLVDVPVKARIKQPISTPDSVLQKKYQFTNVLPTSTFAPEPTQIPATGLVTSTQNTPQPTPEISTTTSPPSVLPSTIESIQVIQITHNSAQIVVRTSNPSFVTIEYAQGLMTLNNRLTSNSTSKTHLFKLSNLSTQSKYTFRLLAEFLDGSKKSSDLYTFQTATRPSEFDFNSLRGVISHSGSAINRFEYGLESAVVFAQNTDMEVSIFPLPESQFEYLALHLFHKQDAQNKTFDQPFATYAITPSATSTSFARGQVPQKTGEYEVYLMSLDRFSNRLFHRLFSLQVSSRFTVISSKTGQKIEQAQVTLYGFNQTERRYTLLASDSLIKQNPIYTLSDGSLDIVFPNGKYKAEVIAHGYLPQIIEFEIDPNTHVKYPEVILEYRGGVLAYIKRTTSIILKYTTGFASVLEEFSRSLAIFSLYSGFTVLLSLILSFASLAARLHISPKRLIFFLRHHWQSVLAQKRVNVRGVVTQKNLTVSHASISFFTPDSTLLLQVLSDRAGIFQASLPTGEYLIEVRKIGYHLYNQQIEIDEKLNHLSIQLAHDRFSIKELGHLAASALYHLLDFSFEIILVSSFLLQTLYIKQFGVLAVLPFLVLSSLNVCIWMTHVVRPKK